MRRSDLAAVICAGLSIALGCDQWLYPAPEKQTAKDHIKEKTSGKSGYFKAMMEETVTEAGGIITLPRLPVRKQPPMPQAIVQLLQEYYDSVNSQDWDRFIDISRQILQIDPEIPEAHIINIVGHAKKGTHLLLVKDYESKIAASPDRAVYHLAMGVLQLELGNPEKALSYLEKAKQIDSATPTLHGNLGKYYSGFAKKLDLRRAIQEYKTEIATTKQPASYFNLHLLYHNQVRDPMEEIKIDEEFDREYPNGMSPIWVESYIYALLDAGEKDKAIAQPESPGEFGPPFFAGLFCG